MSRIGKKPVSVPSSVNVDVNASSRRIKVSGPKGELSYEWHSSIEVSNGREHLIDEDIRVVVYHEGPSRERLGARAHRGLGAR